MSIDHKSYFYIFLCVLYRATKREKQNKCICFYSRRNRAKTMFYILLIYLYRDKIKKALYALSVRYIELYINKRKFPAKIDRE